MQETPQQYTERILGYLEGRDPMAVLAATPRQLARLIDGVSRKRLARRPAPDRWSVTEILAHLADAEVVYGVRIRFIIAASGTPIQATDQDEWSRVFEYAKQDPAHSLEALRVARAQLVRLLKRLPRDSWESWYGMHSERGRETVTRVVELLGGHDLNHMKQIREQLSPAGPPRARS
jgi:hypothetical protein